MAGQSNASNMVVGLDIGTSKVVAIVGKHPGYDLKHAELRVSGLDELTLMSIRDVFRDEAPR